MMGRSQIKKDGLTMESEAIVDVTNGVFTYKKIIHRPEILLKHMLPTETKRWHKSLQKKLKHLV